MTRFEQIKGFDEKEFAEWHCEEIRASAEGLLQSCKESVVNFAISKEQKKCYEALFDLLIYESNQQSKKAKKIWIEFLKEEAR